MLSIIAFICWHAGATHAFTFTEYITTTTLPFQLTATAETVVPTASVSPLSSNVTTTAFPTDFAGQSAYFSVTVTDLFLKPDAPVCQASNASCLSPNATPTSNSIETWLYMPFTISNPPSCTQTSFTYTTSSSTTWFLSDNVFLQFPGLSSQFVQTGTAGEAFVVTTYISTVSIDLGNQAVTTTRCDAYLKGDAIFGDYIEDAGNALQPIAESAYLKECVDPRRFLCSTTQYINPTGSGACGTDWVGPYGSGSGGTATGSGGRGPGVGGPSSTTKAGAANGLEPSLHIWFMMVPLILLGL